jgi:two-component system phosphate regulon sensor histidine kinase PhoR
MLGGTFLSLKFGPEIRPYFFYAALPGLAAFLLLTLIFKKMFSKRLQEMAASADRCAKGDFSQALPVGHDDELDILTDAMNHMARAFRRRLSGVEEEKNQFSGILNHMSEGVFGVDKDGLILTANRSAEKILGLAPGTWRHKSLLEVTRNSYVDEMMQLVIAEQKHRSVEFELSFPQHKVLRASGVAVGERDDAICGILVFYDFTEIRRLENLRQEFVANASHELRTPLTSIKGFIETLLGGAIENPEKSRTFLKMMQEDTERLKRLIDNILDLSRIESKESFVRMETVDLHEETGKIIALLAPHTAEKNLILENRIPQDLPHVQADKDQLTQVLMNLLENAVKFNRENGKIILEAQTLSPRMIEVSVLDTGIGIPEKAVPRIFERFFRVDRARSRDAGGTGLGLAIVKHIIEAHGGEVSCESRLDYGSKFSFTLKIAAES